MNATPIVGRLLEEEEARQGSNQSPLDANAHEVNETRHVYQLQS